MRPSENSPTLEPRTGIDSALADWVEELADRIQAGEAVDLDAYAREFPERAEELRRLLPTIEMMAAFGRSAAGDATGSHWGGFPAGRSGNPGGPLGTLGDFQILREVGRGAMGVVYEAAQESLGRRVALKVMVDQSLSDPKRVERFQREARAAARLHHTNIVPVFGVGEANGVHYYVMQLIRGLGLDRVLKEVRRLRGLSKPHEPAPQAGAPAARQDADASEMARSLVFGRSAATVDCGDVTPADPGVPIEAGPSEATTSASGSDPDPASARGSSSFTLPGQIDVDLSSATSSAGRYVRSVARIGLQVAEALAYAHEQGVLHRDIKPSNLLLDERGNVWLADFGLAKHADSDLTHTGDVVGTLRYMAPERFDGLCDERSDVYSLGLTIYELLATAPAFAGADRNALIRDVMQAEPRRLRSLDKSIPRDLETIVHKAIEKDPAHRYATAKALAEDLRRFLEDGPITARRTGPAERLLRWGRRHPAVASLAALVFLLLAGITGLSTAAAVRIERQAAEARAETVRTNQALEAEERARKDAERTNAQLIATRETLRRTLYAAQMNQARAAWDADNPARMVRLLDRQKPAQGQVDLRDWEWRYLSQLAHSELRSISLPITLMKSVAFSPDGRRLLIAGGVGLHKGEVAVADVAGGLAVVSRKFEDGPVLGAAYSADGTRIAAACWSYRDAERRVVAGRVEVWDAATGRSLLTIKDDLGTILGVAFSPDGTRIAAVDGVEDRHRRRVKVWDAATGQPRFTIDAGAPLSYDHDVAFSPDGTRIASGGYGPQGEVKVWDASDGRELLTLKGHSAPVPSLAFSADGRRIATAGWDATIRIWDAATGREQLKLTANSPTFFGVAFSPDGSRVAGASVARKVVIWDTQDGHELGTIKGLTAPVHSVAFSPDGRLLATSDTSGTVKVWEVLPRRNPRVFGERGESVALLAYRPDGRFIATAARGGPTVPRGAVKLWNAADGRIERTLGTSPLAVNALQYSPDGTRVAAGGRAARQTGEVKIWDEASGKETATLGLHPGPVVDLAYSPDGRFIATAATSGFDTPRSQAVAAVKVWDAASGREVRSLEGISLSVVKVIYSGDGRWIATAEGGGIGEDNPGRLRVWDAESGREVRAIEAPSGSISALAISPDNAKIAATTILIRGEAGPIKVWELATGRELFALEGHSGSANGVAFSPNGTRIATSSADRTVKLWDAIDGEDLLTLGGQADSPPFQGVTFSPDGTRITAAGRDVPLTTWDAGPRRD